MKKGLQTRRCSQEGIALLIAIFVLLLISVVAIALLVSSGTETALGANYRSSSTVYYAALAGLEEARGRLLPKNPGYLGAANIPPSAPLPIGQTIYITNPATGEAVTPCDTSNAYYDKEYYTEFGVASESTSCTGFPSVWVGNTYPGPMYKWVRVNSATEQSIYTDVDDDGSKENTTPLLYDPGNVNYSGNPWPSLIRPPTPPASPLAVPTFEITALAELPNKSKKMLQYLVAPVMTKLSFPAAVTMSGNNVQFSVPNSSWFKVDGTDHPTAITISGQTCAASGPVNGVGYTNSGDSSQSNIINAIPSMPPTSYNDRPNYTGLGGSTPNVNPVGVQASLQSVGQLETLVQTITQNADVVVNGPATQSIMPSAMSATNPMTIVVNGDLTLSGWRATGYGLLLVTGTFTYDPDAYWDGVVLVIGKGVIYSYQGGVGTINGALFLATTVDSSGNPLPASSSLGSPYFDFTSGAGGHGVTYSSCAVQLAQPALTYKILSFHEIPQ